MRRPLSEHLTEYKRDGYTIFRGFLSAEEVSAIRAVCDPKCTKRFDRSKNPLARTTIGGHDGWGDGEHTALGTRLMAATVFNPSGVLLDFVETVMGPCVQHDSLQVACYPPVPAEYSGVGYSWHFDGFNSSTTSTAKRPKEYTPPYACNCLTYLQDMDGAHGALRVVPGSHLNFGHQVPEREPGPASQHWPVPGEVCLDAKAGDLCITHCDLMHGSTYNTSNEYRYFISEYVQAAGLPHRDAMDDAAWEPYVAAARERDDSRILRFFGDPNALVEHQARLERVWNWQIQKERDEREQQENLASGGPPSSKL